MKKTPQEPPSPLADRRDHERRDHDRRDIAHVPPRLGVLRRVGIWSTLGVLAASGALWLYIQYGYTPPNDDFEPHRIQGPAMQVHAAAALLSLLIAGSLFDTHMRVAWRRLRNRVSGTLMTATGVAVAASGYGLWYFNGDELHNAAEIIHWVTGFGLPLLAGLHVWSGRRSRSQQ